MTEADISGIDAEYKALRTYARALYERPGVREHLLALQDDEGADINLVLFCCYRAIVKNHALDIETLKRLIAHVADWREHILLPTRAFRRQIKHTMLKDQSLSVVYGAMLVSEIEAEYVQQAMLVQCVWAQEWQRPDKPISRDEQLETVQTILLSYFGLLQSVCDGECIRRIRDIAQEAVFLYRG